MADVEKLRSELVYSFVSWCDSNTLSLTTGLDLAEKLAEDITEAADDRRLYLPPSLMDEDTESDHTRGEH